MVHKNRTRRGIHYGTADEKTAGKVVWTQETEPIGLWAYAEPEPLFCPLPAVDRRGPSAVHKADGASNTSRTRRSKVPGKNGFASNGAAPNAATWSLSTYPLI